MSKDMVFIGNEELVVSFEADSIGELAIHPYMTLDHDYTLGVDEHLWIVTHVESGLKMESFAKKNQAITYAKSFYDNIGSAKIATYSGRGNYWTVSQACILAHNVAMNVARNNKR
jgi:hypothetical protein